MTLFDSLGYVASNDWMGNEFELQKYVEVSGFELT
jgi:hypothetical protein